jgi:hypothetical protein
VRIKPVKRTSLASFLSNYGYLTWSDKREASQTFIILVNISLIISISFCLLTLTFYFNYSFNVFGNLTQRKLEDTIQNPLDDKPAITAYRAVRYDPSSNITLVDIIIRTGRKHQIRRHFEKFGFPMMGDQRYGQGNKNTEGMQLSTTALDLDDNAISPVAGAIVNFGKRFTLRLDYFGYHDDAKARADSSFEFDDLIVPEGAHVDSSFDLDVIAVNLAYNFYHSARARFGVGVGVHAADIDLELSAKVLEDGKEVDLGEGNADLLAPVPNLYAYGAYAFTDRFLLRYGGGWLSMKYGDYDGSLIFGNAFFEYWPFQYAGFGAGYRYVHADIEYDPENKEEEYDVKLPGPLLYVTFGF